MRARVFAKATVRRGGKGADLQEVEAGAQCSRISGAVFETRQTQDLACTLFDYTPEESLDCDFAHPVSLSKLVPVAVEAPGDRSPPSSEPPAVTAHHSSLARVRAATLLPARA